MIVTQKILDTIRDFQIEMMNQNIDVKSIWLSQWLTEYFTSERITHIHWIELI